jgi:CHASE2 domain-containing sensor protein
LCVIGLWSLVGGILWKTTSPLNILLKTILLSTSILSFSIIY